jgi:uncharacterized protein (TIGR02453 family)
MKQYTKITFKFLDAVNKNKKNKLWFEKNKHIYETAVLQATEYLLKRINEEHKTKLPKFDISPKRITKLTRRFPGPEGEMLRSNIQFFLGEKMTSRFEWNPGIYFSVGSKADDTVLGIGLYMVSSRQLSLLRNALVEDYDTIHKILSNPKLKKSWGVLQGEVYKRFPKAFDEKAHYAKYMKHKQFYLAKEYSRKDILKKGFIESVVKDIGTAIPFLIWIRKTVGTYSQKNTSFIKQEIL